VSDKIGRGANVVAHIQLSPSSERAT
jgi:hypothetical protein